ncbi:Uncharacterised protein [uncultured archaeon]|nr:Uncharacterised protein [uncultured archaeon]
MNCQDLNLVIGLYGSVEHQIIGSILGWNDLNENFKQHLKLHYDKKEVDFMMKHKDMCFPEYFWKRVILTDELLSQKRIKQDWKAISKNESLTLELALKYKEQLKPHWYKLIRNLNIPWSELKDVIKHKKIISKLVDSSRTDIPEQYVKDNFMYIKDEFYAFSSTCSEEFWIEHINEWAPTSELQESQAEIIIKLNPQVKLNRSKFMSVEFVKKYKDNIEDYEEENDEYEEITYLDKCEMFIEGDDSIKEDFINTRTGWLSEHDLELHYAHITNFRDLIENTFISENFIERHISDLEYINDNVAEDLDLFECLPISGEFFLKHISLSSHQHGYISKHHYYIPLDKINVFMSYLAVRCLKN